jgi:hypothetical protein
MKGIVRWKLSAALIATLLSGFLHAQQPADAAPVPARVLSAKRIFIANTPPRGPEIIDAKVAIYSGGPYRCYNQSYMAIKAWDRFDLVSSPADADLIFEVSYEAGPRFEDPRYLPNQLRLVIVDSKSQVPLWWMSEAIFQGTHRQDSDKLFDGAMAKLVQDVKDLVVVPTGAVSSERKTQ